MSLKPISPEIVAKFKYTGCIVIKNFCTSEETTLLLKAAVSRNHASRYSNPFNGAGLASWFSPGNNLFGYFARSGKIVHAVSELMECNEPLCHVQSKLMEKKPEAGGVWGWHQDFAYWKTNGFKSSAQMISVMVALTPVNQNNGCSRIISGSHVLPTLKHSFDDEQTPGVDAGAMDNVLQKMTWEYVEVEAGDAVFFHSNLLHCAGKNGSCLSTWSAISCYSTLSNIKLPQIFKSWQTPVEIIPDDKVFNMTSGTSPGRVPADTMLKNQQLVRSQE